MAKDDYHVIVCKILKYLYACLKTGEDVDSDKLMEIIGDLPERYAEYIIRALHEEGYVTGSYSETMRGKEKPQLTSETMITPKGIEYIADNKYMVKVRDYLDRH